MVEAIVKEITLRKNYLKSKDLTSIYLGGGTPSLLSAKDLDLIFGALSRYYSWDRKTEITLEVNPDDLSASKLLDIKKAGINRLSIGVQSFDQNDLTFMNRAHNAEEAEKCIKEAQDIGFENITADLIYGSPTTSASIWEANMEKMIAFGIPHISAYCLTVEEGTALHHFVSNGKTRPVDDEKASQQFAMLISKLNEHGYDHYEISNFGKSDSYAVHNTNYWMGAPYLGLGPAAHSFDGDATRSWNIAHNQKYMSELKNGILPSEQEVLAEKEKFNEFILIRLRTKWGIDDKTLHEEYGSFANQLHEAIKVFLERNQVERIKDAYVLTDEGKHMADRISMELFAD